MSDDAERETPRWGNRGRGRKADAIWQTLHATDGELSADETWVDVGCGSGGIAAALAPRVRRIVGIDPEPWEQWRDAESAHPNLSMLAGRFDGDRIPLPLDFADVLICNQVYEHVSYPEKLIRNIYSVLKPGGVCYFAGPNLLWPIEPHVKWPFVHWLPRARAHRLMRALGADSPEQLDAYSTHYWRLTSWFEEAGFDYRSAIVSRAAAEFEVRGARRMGRVLRAFVPERGILPFVPAAPGFVFVLRKP